jgi:hypothetical protein
MSKAGNWIDRNLPTQRRDHMQGSCISCPHEWDFAEADVVLAVCGQVDPISFFLSVWRMPR